MFPHQVEPTGFWCHSQWSACSLWVVGDPFQKASIKWRSHSILDRKLEKCKVNPRVTALYAFRLRQPAEPLTWLKLTPKFWKSPLLWHFYLLKEFILEKVHPTSLPWLTLQQCLTAAGHMPTSELAWQHPYLRDGEILSMPWFFHVVTQKVPSYFFGSGTTHTWRKLWIFKRVHFYTHQISQFIFLFK